MFDSLSHSTWIISTRNYEHACVWIYSCFLSETNETNSRDALRIAFESLRNCVGVTSGLLLSHFGIAFELPIARNCVWVNSELSLSHLGNAFESPPNCFWVTSELPLRHLTRNCFWDNSELRLSHLGMTFESPRNYVWMTLIAKLVVITWPLGHIVCL